MGAQLPPYEVGDSAVCHQLIGEHAKYNNVPCKIIGTDQGTKRQVQFTVEDSDLTDDKIWLNIYYLRPQFVVGQLIRGTILDQQASSGDSGCRKSPFVSDFLVSNRDRSHQIRCTKFLEATIFILKFFVCF